MAVKGKLKKLVGGIETDLYPHTTADIVSYTAGTTVAPNPSGSVGKKLDEIQGSIDALPQTLVSSVQGHTGAVTLYGNEIPSSSSTGAPNLIDSNGKVPLSLLPDVIVGSLSFGGTVSAYNSPEENIVYLTVSVSSALKELLGLGASVTTIYVYSGASNTTYNNETAYGYIALEGVYFVMNVALNIPFGGATAPIAIGDWVISTGSSWQKIVSTDSVTGVKGNAESTYRMGNVNLTPANLGISATTTTGSEAITIGSSTLNLVTRDTAQTISGYKTFSNGLKTNGGIQSDVAFTIETDGGDITLETGSLGSVVVDSSKLKIHKYNANSAILDTTNITTSDKTFYFPNQGGTIALSEDLYFVAD